MSVKVLDMPWFPEIAGPAFCETVQLRRRIIERQQLPRSCWLEVLEPSNAEFIAALAAGNNAHHILQIGCGISTIALAAAARATGSYVLSIHIDKEKQEIINDHIQYLGLVEYVRFLTDEPRNVIPLYEEVDFVFISGDPQSYIELFDLLSLSHKAVIVADNALDEALNEYIKHVRRQPGIHSSTLPVGRGIEVTKILSWDKFNSGRIFYSNFCQEIDEDKGCCNCEDVILPDGSFPSITGVNLDHSVDGNLLQSPTKCEKCDAKRNVSEEGIASVSFFQTDDDLKDPMDGGCSSIHQFEDPKLNTCEPEPNPEECHSRIGFRVHLKNEPLHTEISIKGKDQDMLLADITMAFNEMGISVQQARISTEEKIVEDVFCVVDSETHAPMDPSIWDTVRERILERIISHRKDESDGIIEIA